MTDTAKQTSERERLPDFWAAYGPDGDEKRDQCIDYAVSTDDANGGRIAREMVNQWINDRLQDNPPETYHLVGVNFDRVYIGVDPTFQQAALEKIDSLHTQLSEAQRHSEVVAERVRACDERIERQNVELCQMRENYEAHCHQLAEAQATIEALREAIYANVTTPELIRIRSSIVGYDQIKISSRMVWTLTSLIIDARALAHSTPAQGKEKA